jgi:hypothetical protein
METTNPQLLINQGREPAARGPLKSLVVGGLHYIRNGDGVEELYVLLSDQEERDNVAGAAYAQPDLQRFRNALWSMYRRKIR